MPTIVVRPQQARTYACPVGEHQIVRIEPNYGDKWLVDGRNWVDAGGSGQGAGVQTPRPGESEGAVVIYKDVTVLESFAGRQAALEVQGPFDLYLGPNSYNPDDDNQGAIRVEVNVRNA
jgi:hypothetical protein